MRRVSLGLLLAGFLSAGAAHAQTSSPLETLSPQGKPEENDWLFTVQVENEALIPGRNDDRYYTQGLQFHALSPARRMPFADRTHRLPFFLEVDAPYRGGLAIGQNIYTPENLRLAEPDPKDRPYAGWLYVGGEVLTYSQKELNSLQLQVGMVGPTALGGLGAEQLAQACPSHPRSQWLGLSAQGRIRLRAVWRAPRAAERTWARPGTP